MKTMVSTAASVPTAAAPSSDVLRAGAKAGPWIVERELGHGGMGAVYAVVHEEIGKRAALKVVHQRLLATGFNSDRMLLEAKVVNQVGHPNIVDIFETGKLGDGRPYIVMERLDGMPLSARADEGKLLPDLVTAILLQVCDALIAAHATGVVHRDLKPDNVFLVDNADDPANPKVKLLDWGIAKVLADNVKHTVEGQLVGTPQYLAPEQARGLEVSPQTDVYSLGVMAFELFLEQLPFEAETAPEVMAMHLRMPPPQPSDLWPEIPESLESLLLQMLAKPAAQRPAMTEVARRLESIRIELRQRRQGHTMPLLAGGERTSRELVIPPVLSSSQRARAQSAPRAHASHRSGALAGAPHTPSAPALSASSSGARPSRPSHKIRVVSSAGLSATQPAMWRSGAKKWQYVLGASALAASAMLFWISRVGDRTADAATTVRHVEQAIDDSAHDRPSTPAIVSRTRSAARFAPTTTIAAATSEVEAAVEPAAEPSARPVAEAVREAAARPGPAPVSAPARASQRLRVTAARSAPAAASLPLAPRRGAKIDPDGTIDAYR